MSGASDDVPEDVRQAALRAMHDTVEQHQDGISINKRAIEVMILGAARAIMAERERCAQVCEAEATLFLSPEYASNQPLGSITERFACDECAKAIRKGTAP